MSVIFPDLDSMLRNRGIRCRPDGSFAEDSWDFGVWWRDASGGVYRLTWIGPRMRDDPSIAGELYLVRLSGPHVSEIDLRGARETESHLGYYERHGRGSAGLSADEDEELSRARVVSAGSALGPVELLCTIPPIPPVVEERDGRPALELGPEENVDAILTGWAEVCGAPNSVAWVHDRVWEALRAGWAAPAKIQRGASHVA